MVRSLSLSDNKIQLCKGIMAYNVHEAKFLWETYGFKDIYVAYPCVQEQELQVFCEVSAIEPGVLTATVDSEEHVVLLEHAYQNFFSGKDTKTTRPFLAVVIDMDMSYRPLGGLFHFGVQRSPCRTLEQFKKVHLFCCLC